MNKQKGIIIGILALAVTMMVGYALFSETITINGTATAKGGFDVTVDCNAGIDSKLAQALGLESNPQAAGIGYKNDSCTVTGNAVSFSSELEYPGANRVFTVKITNNGTIDALLNMESEIPGTTESCIGNYDTGEFSDCKTGGTQAFGDILTDQIVGFEKSDGTIISTLGENFDAAPSFFDEQKKNVILEPGESMYYVFQAFWDYLGGEIEGSQKVLYKETKTYEFVFNQPTS